MKTSGDYSMNDAAAGTVVPFRRPRRERDQVSRMIGRWPDGIRFEDAAVPREGFFRGGGRDVPGVWPESSLSLEVGIARKR